MRVRQSTPHTGMGMVCTLQGSATKECSRVHQNVDLTGLILSVHSACTNAVHSCAQETPGSESSEHTTRYEGTWSGVHCRVHQNTRTSRLDEVLPSPGPICD